MDKRARRASIEGSIRARRASIEGGSTNQESPPSSSAAKKRNLGAFKEREIWNVVRYMDGNGDGSITFGELELAFRTSRRTKAASKLKGRGKKVLGRIKQLIKDLDISVHVWFEMMDSAGDSEGNGSISSMELRKGLKLLVGKRRRFTENEIVDLIRYMDPNADGDLTLEEVEIAVARSNEGDSEEVRITEENHRVLCRLEEHIFIGKDVHRLPNTSCISIPGWSGETAVMQLDLAGFAISSGSACSSGSVSRSKVLKSLGYDDVTAGSAIRVSLGPYNTENEVLDFVDVWSHLYKKFKAKAA